MSAIYKQAVTVRLWPHEPRPVAIRRSPVSDGPFLVRVFDVEGEQTAHVVVATATTRVRTSAWVLVNVELVAVRGGWLTRLWARRRGIPFRVVLEQRV